MIPRFPFSAHPPRGANVNTHDEKTLRQRQILPHTLRHDNYLFAFNRLSAFAGESEIHSQT